MGILDILDILVFCLRFKKIELSLKLLFIDVESRFVFVYFFLIIFLERNLDCRVWNFLKCSCIMRFVMCCYIYRVLIVVSNKRWMWGYVV